MRSRRIRALGGLGLLLLGAAVPAIYLSSHRPPRVPDVPDVRSIIEVHPGEDIQSALDEAAARTPKAIVRLQAGIHRPARPGQALVFFNARHDGVVLEGAGAVTLTAANPQLATAKTASFPAIVNHVVYFGDGVTGATVLRNVTIAGGNGYTEGPPGLIDVQTVEDLIRSARFRAFESPIEENAGLEKTHEFYCDGAGILVFGHSYPVIENVVVASNCSRVCGGGVSIQHCLTELAEPVQFRNCIFRENRARVSGAAIDVFSAGSWVDLDNCLFVANENEEKLERERGTGDNSRHHGFGALSVFPTCRATVRRCTFAFNRSAVDDRGMGSVYEQCLFWMNNRGSAPGHSHFELNVNRLTRVEGCCIHGEIDDVHSVLALAGPGNRLEPTNPEFDDAFCPRQPSFDSIGYRPGARSISHDQ